MWYRIFARGEQSIEPVELLEALKNAGLEVEGHFRGDDLGWTAVELVFGQGAPALLDRYLVKEDDIRHDLNSWAAELETMDYSPNNGLLMERVIQTQQMFTLRKPVDQPDEVLADRLCLEICRFFAGACDGVYQVDGQGWFDAAGHLLLQEY